MEHAIPTAGPLTPLIRGWRARVPVRTPQAQPPVDVIVDIPEEDTARDLLAFLQPESGCFARIKTRYGSDCVTGGAWAGLA
jgi:hypothetical protein